MVAIFNGRHFGALRGFSSVPPLESYLLAATMLWPQKATHSTQKRAAFGFFQEFTRPTITSLNQNSAWPIISYLVGYIGIYINTTKGIRVDRTLMVRLDRPMPMDYMHEWMGLGRIIKCYQQLSNKKANLT